MMDLDLLAKLLLDLEAVGVRTVIPERDNLRPIPVVAIPSDLLAQVKAHKADLPAALRSMCVPTGLAPAPDPFANWVLRPDSRGVMGWQSPDAPELWPAWEDSPTLPDLGPKCGSLELWQDALGGWHCQRCKRATFERGLRLAERAARLREAASTKR